jgi:PEP-CTERM motif
MRTLPSTVSRRTAGWPGLATLRKPMLIGAFAALGFLPVNQACAASTYAEASASISGFDLVQQKVSGGNGGAQASADLLADSNAGQASSHGGAAASVGGLRVSTLAVANVGTDAQGNALAQWADGFEIAAAGHVAGERGSFTAAVGVQGGLLAEFIGLGYADSYVVANFFLNSGVDGGNFAAQGGGRRSVGYDIDSTSSGLESFVLYFENVPFAFGQEISVTLKLGTVSAVRTFGSGNARAEADYGHTMTWSGLSNVRDSSGNLIPNFTAVSASSGFDFANVAAVPEPSSAILIAFGMVSMGWRLRRKA